MFRADGPESPHSHEYERLLNQEELILEATELIHQLLETTGTTKAQLAERLGTTRGHVTQVLNGSRNMTLRTLADFTFALGHRVMMDAAPFGTVHATNLASAAAYPTMPAAVAFTSELTNTSFALPTLNNLVGASGVGQLATNDLVGMFTGTIISGINALPSFTPQYETHATWPDWSTIAASGTRRSPGQTPPTRQAVAA